MSINTNNLYQQLWTANGLNDTSRLKTAFVQSVNRTIVGLNSRAGQSVDEITGLADNIDLAASYGDIVLRGIKYFIQDTGEWVHDPPPDAERKWETAVSEARKLYWETSGNEPWAGAHGNKLSEQ